MSDCIPEPVLRRRCLCWESASHPWHPREQPHERGSGPMYFIELFFFFCPSRLEQLVGPRVKVRGRPNGDGHGDAPKLH